MRLSTNKDRSRGGKVKGKNGVKPKASKGLEAKIDEAPEAPSADQTGAAAGVDPEDEGSKVTRALVDALRAFSQPKWWLIGRQESKKDAAADAPRRKRMKPEEFQQKCAEKHAEMRRVYESTMMQDSEQRWLRKMSSEGTSGDKCASLTMLIQVCPVFATGYIKSLLTMAGKTTRSDSIMAMDALRDLFINNLLPDRKLRTAVQMDPVSPKGLSKVEFTEIAVVAYFEDFLKTAFAGFVHVLSEAAHSSVAFFKNKAVRTAYELLAAKPEQERALLALLVNKMGDHTSKVASNVSHHLESLVEAHPMMKSIVTKEVESLLSRSNLTLKSQYCALLFLAEMKFTRERDAELAAEHVRLFVTHLERILTPGRDRGSKTDGKGGKTRKSRLKLKRRRAVRVQHGIIEEDNKLVRALINGIQRKLPYLDDSTTGSPVHTEMINTLFKVCHTVAAFSTRIAILSLLYRCIADRPGMPTSRFYQLVYDQLLHFDMWDSMHRNQIYFLLAKCIPADPLVGRSFALTRRFLQVGSHLAAPVGVGSLTVLRELLASRRAELRPLMQNVQSAIADDAVSNDEEEEKFLDDAGAAEAAQSQARARGYTPRVRDPRFAKARQTPLWELYALRNHVHPFVADGAHKLMKAERFATVGDNIFESFSTSEFLQDFVEFTRLKREPAKDKRNKYKKDKSRISLATDRFSQKKNALPHERFMQIYVRDSVVAEKRTAKKKKGDDESDVDEENVKKKAGGDEQDEPARDDEADAFFDEYLQQQMPKDESDGDGPDIDDDDDEDCDFGEDPGSEDDDPLRNEAQGDDDLTDLDGAVEAADGDDDQAADADSLSEDQELKPSKRKAPEEDDSKLTPKQKRLKELKKKHGTSGLGMFASAEDFDGLLDD